MNLRIAIVLACLLAVSSAKRDLLNPCDQPVSTNISSELEGVPQCILSRNPYILVNCSIRGLTAVPNMATSNVEILDLSFNIIRHVRVGDFDGYTSLVVLDLNYNCLKVRQSGIVGPYCFGDLYIEPGALEPLSQLKLLLLKSNYLREFPTRLPKSIVLLDITRTFLGDVTTHIKKELPNLLTLIANTNCARNYLNVCLRNFTLSSQLPCTMLDLMMNGWRSIPGYLFSKNLTTLKMIRNPINRILKGDFVNATNMRKLYLHGLLNHSGPLILEPGSLDPMTRLQILDLSINDIEHIPPYFFKYNSELEHLDLSMNCLMMTVIDPTFLAGLSHLRYLDLSSNADCLPDKVAPVIPTLRLSSVYSTLKSLKFLMIGAPPTSSQRGGVMFSLIINTISPESFLSLSKLNLLVLSLSDCSVQTIETNSFHNLTKLTALYLSHNNLGFCKERNSSSIRSLASGFRMKPAFSYNKNQKIADRSKVSSFDYEIGTLDYSHNLITSIADVETSHLRKVFVLNFSYNYIRFIRSTDLENLRCLKSLNLAKNPLQEVDPTALQNLVNLESLTMVNTNFLKANISFLEFLSPSSKVSLKWIQSGDDVVDCIFMHLAYPKHHNATLFESVVSLEFSDNLGGSLSTKTIFSLRIFPSLVKLIVSDCGLSDSISINFFSDLNQLEILDISHNEFRQLPTSFLRNLKNLTEIDVSFNFITHLTLDFFSNLTQLKDFRASRNKISFIEPNIFKHSRLRRLDLSYNYIQTLDSSILSKEVLQSLSYLDIRWNELDCYCEVWETFYIWYISDESKSTILPGFLPTCSAELGEFYGGCVACESPRGLPGRSVSRYGYNTSCELATMTGYALLFTAFVFIFLMSGTIGYSKWFKRMVFRKLNDQFRVESLEKSNESAKTTNRYLSFVCYDHENQEAGNWVDTRLVPTMRKAKPPINLVVSGRDDACSVGRSQQVLRRALQCHKTIVLLTDDFCDSPVCRFLITALQELQYSQGQDKMILVTWYGDRAPRVPDLIQRTMNRRRHCFLRFDHANDDEALFFDVLHAQLLSSNSEELYKDVFQ